MNNTEFVPIKPWWREPTRRELLEAKNRAVAWAIAGWLAAILFAGLNFYLIAKL